MRQEIWQERKTDIGLLGRLPARTSKQRYNDGEGGLRDRALGDFQGGGSAGITIETGER